MDVVCVCVCVCVFVTFGVLRGVKQLVKVSVCEKSITL